MNAWVVVLTASLGCAALKLGGHLAPARWVQGGVVRRAAELLPVALLSALVATSSLATGHALVVGSRTAGLLVAALLTWRRAPFVVIVVGACAVAALTHALRG